MYILNKYILLIKLIIRISKTFTVRSLNENIIQIAFFFFFVKRVKLILYIFMNNPHY